MPLLLRLSIRYYGVTNGGLYVNATICEAGRYCQGGVPFLCPAGRFGGTEGLQLVECTGACFAGYYCQPGSVTATQARCFDSAAGFCPEVRVRWEL